MSAWLFWHVLTMEVRKHLSYRANFWANALFGFAIQLGAAFFVWQAVFRESGQAIIGGYTFPQMVTYYVLVLLLGKLVRGVEFGAGGISDEIYQGTMTRYLIYPTRVFPFKYAQHLGQIAPSAVQLAVLGGLAFVVLPVGEHVTITLQSVVMTLLALAAANLLHYLIFWPVESVAFWQDNVWSLNVMMRFVLGLLGGAMLPLSVFPDWARLIIGWLPFQYLFAFPVNVLMGRVTPQEWVIGIGTCLLWCGIAGLLAAAVWRRGLRQYAGVGI